MATAEKDLLSGAMFPKIVRFSLPLMLTNLLQMCYSAADMIIVGYSGVEGAIGAIGTTGSLINLILNVFIGFAVGGTVVIARYIGARNEESTGRAVHTALLAGLIFGVAGSAIGIFACKPLLKLIGNEGNILTLSVLYCRVYFAGIPFLSLTNYAIAVFRAKGDTRTPMYVLTGSGLLNVGLNLFFVLCCHMSVDGVALATSLSSMSSTVTLLIIMSRDKGWCRFSVKKLKLSTAIFMEMVRIGIPAGVQGAVFSVSNLLIQSSITGLNNSICPGGSYILDGNAAGISLEYFPYMISNAVCQASVTFTSQHYGGMQFRRIGSVMKSCYLLTGIVTVLSCGLIWIFRYTLVGLYVTDPQAVEIGILRLKILFPGYIFVAFMEIGSGVLRGLDHSLTSTVNSLLGSCVFRIIWIFTVFQIYHSLEIVFLSYPISWIVTALVNFLFVLHYWKPLVRKEKQWKGEA